MPLINPEMNFITLRNPFPFSCQPCFVRRTGYSMHPFVSDIVIGKNSKKEKQAGL